MPTAAVTRRFLTVMDGRSRALGFSVGLLCTFPTLDKSHWISHLNLRFRTLSVMVPVLKVLIQAPSSFSKRPLTAAYA